MGPNKQRINQIIYLRKNLLVYKRQNYASEKLTIYFSKRLIMLVLYHLKKVRVIQFITEVALIQWKFQSIMWSVYFSLLVFPLLKIYRYRYMYSKWQLLQPDSHLQCLRVVLSVYIAIYIQENVFGIRFCFELLL